MYKEDFALNNLQWLICHKTKPNWKSLYKVLDSAVKIFLGSHLCKILWSILNELILSFFLWCSVLVYHGYTNVDISPWRLGARLKHLPHH